MEILFQLLMVISVSIGVGFYTKSYLAGLVTFLFLSYLKSLAEDNF